jgi:hypothetical protein
MIAGLRLDLLQARPGLQREGKKLRAVIVTVFRLVASPGQKTKSATAQGAVADQCKNRRSSLVAAHQQGQGNLSFNSSAPLNGLLNTWARPCDS